MDCSYTHRLLGVPKLDSLKEGKASGLGFRFGVAIWNSRKGRSFCPEDLLRQKKEDSVSRAKRSHMGRPGPIQVYFDPGLTSFRLALHL